MAKVGKSALIPSIQDLQEGQCHFYVIRKKRFCRMTVRPGKNYCGEHEPKPKTADGQDDTRIPCPLDSKHTCYASKLEKHLSICNARQCEELPYLTQNINSPAPVDDCLRRPLSEVPREHIQIVVEKINKLYNCHIKNHITPVPMQPIHTSVLPEFNESSRTESSLRHLRQVSSLLHIAESSGLVQDQTCYVELGAGKGQLSYYLGVSWCQKESRVLSVDRACLRHKRDNRLRSERKPADISHHNPEDNTTTSANNTGVNQCSDVAVRLRADLAHLALEKVPVVEGCRRVVGFAKHLCGVATDFALRCLTADGVLSKCRGGVMATCCHHRCERPAYVANEHLLDLGITSKEFNIMLGLVSWATCGDGRSRELRNHHSDNESLTTQRNIDSSLDLEDDDKRSLDEKLRNREYREQVGRKAKLIIDWGRVLYLRERGFDAQLCYYVGTSVSLENVCIVAKTSV